MKNLLIIASFIISAASFAQGSYEDSMKTFIKNYVQNHEVVKGHDKDHMQFFAADKTYRVTADFTPTTGNKWLSFKTSGTKEKVFKVYGVLSFQLNGKIHRLNLYQSQEMTMTPGYQNYLFLPFTDSTTGHQTYSSGRYLDLTTSDIKNNKVVLDFNKAYNPYCAYVSGVYNCPIPPKENELTVAIKAGEKTFTSGH